MRYLLLVVMSLALVACATRQTLVSTPAASVNEYSFDKGYKAKKLGPVKADYCAGDEAITGDKTQVGLMDEVLARAQKEKQASYIADATFYLEGSHCISVEGTAMKVEQAPQ